MKCSVTSEPTKKTGWAWLALFFPSVLAENDAKKIAYSGMNRTVSESVRQDAVLAINVARILM